MVTTLAETPFTSVIPSVRLVVMEVECSKFPLISLVKRDFSSKALTFAQLVCCLRRHL
jgi:hypothetical protein